mmetsp:Transcript_7116/g.9968  ORF Transcript_7116/g.9968 Transcript_7116/m.9968 type:complete len:213 (+) Transcript_7116:137-775(+)
MVVGGKLVFKGGKVAKKKSVDKKARSSESNSRKGEKIDLKINGVGALEAEEEEELMPETGTGRITSSGTAVAGYSTKFLSELKVGDALMVFHPTALTTETKLVRMVLSDKSIGISSAFSSDLISTTNFQYISAPKDKNLEDPEVERENRKKKEEDKAYGTYASQGGTKVVYRVKKAGQYGGYEIMTENSEKPMTREDLLNVRSKKKADRYCY